MNILALDVGTSSVKAAILEVATAMPVTAAVSVAYDLDRSRPYSAVVSAEVLWQAVDRAAREARAAAPNATLDGIGLSCMTPAMILLGEDDRPLTPIWTHFDRRSRPLARAMRDDRLVAEELLHSAGNPPLPGGLSAFSAAQQLAEEPALRPQVRRYMHANGWLALRLTGTAAFDPAGACFTGLFNALTDRQWSERWCRYFQVDRSWLPPVVDGANTVGPLRHEWATAWGVPRGLPVKLGTADTSSAMLAAGMKPGDLLHVVGTTQVLAAFADPPCPAVCRLTRPLGVGPDFIHVTHNPVGGEALRWLFDLCERDANQTDADAIRLARAHFFETTVPAALDRPTTVILDPPFLGGDRLEVDERTATFRGLTLDTTRLDLVAAVLNGMRKGHAKALADLGLGTSWPRVFLTGGGSEIVEHLNLYPGSQIVRFDDGSLRGVARLFAGPS